jgi:hypothetical protein
MKQDEFRKFADVDDLQRQLHDKPSTVPIETSEIVYSHPDSSVLAELARSFSVAKSELLGLMLTFAGACRFGPISWRCANSKTPHYRVGFRSSVRRKTQ